MKRSVSCLAIAAIFIFATLDLVAQTKKYDIKSGTITFEMTQKMSGFDTKNKVVVSFDDYGIKECRETYEGDEISEVYFSDGKELYTLKPAKKAAYKRGKAYRGTEMKFDWGEVSGRDKKEGKAKQLPNTTIAGKTCESFQYASDGTTTKYAGWNRILLLIDLTTKDLTSVTKAVKVDEKTVVAPEKFRVPAGYNVE
jgi:hypothetical protein